MFDDSSLTDGFLVADNNLQYRRSPRLLDKVCGVIRCKHDSIRMEQIILALAWSRFFLCGDLLS
jgi:hypothetical protein